jgi:hypothetical protein
VELTPAQRKLAFAVVVFVLAGLGVYLVTTGHHSSGHPAASGSSAPGGGQGATVPTTPAATATVPTAPASAPPSPTTSSQSGTPNIYQWLPFTPAGLKSAATLTDQFGAAYGTYSYTQSPAAYLRTLSGYVTPDLGKQIEAAYATPGVASLRKSQKQVATGSAQITSLMAFGSTSLTFVVTVTQNVTATRDGGQKTTSYDITVTGGDTSWQVSNVELAGQGNF